MKTIFLKKIIAYTRDLSANKFSFTYAKTAYKGIFIS